MESFFTDTTERGILENLTAKGNIQFQAINLMDPTHDYRL
jgi:hypothetical protein